MPSPAIQDLAIIGDCRSAALVDRGADVVWLCWPSFDSRALFAALIDEPRRGHFRLAPSGEGWEVSRCYRDGSNVLQTTFTRAGAEVCVTDLMVVASEEDQRALPMAEHEL